MRIKVAKTAGFCFGVDRAVKMAFDTAEKFPRVVTLGPIIHNPQIVAQLEKMGFEQWNHRKKSPPIQRLSSVPMELEKRFMITYMHAEFLMWTPLVLL